ncbi:MAG TPA: PaaI family thioesterase [Gaiellaceae bacterium]|nr:PaaI family thioesterase [Gaiellaceae bacterium]
MAPHVWVTLGYRGIEQADGEAVIEWDAPIEYCFTGSSGPIVHGGLVTTLLDTAMGGACHSLLEGGETFLTADLHSEFLRPTRPGTLRAIGRVVHRTKRMMFCAADLHDADGKHLASGRCTQVLLSER